jgi:glutamyl-tRNA reductase
VSIGFVGTDHTRVSLSLRERLAVAGERLDRLLDLLRAEPLISEAAVLSTCNRVEIYVAAPDASAALTRATHHLLTVTGVAPADIAGALDVRIDAEAVRHLFAVAAALRSLVVGETQILTQVREAFTYAAARGVAGAELQALARLAVRCGKQVRAETLLGTVDTSVSAVAVDLAARYLGPLRTRSALLIGAGRINEVSAQLLREAGIGSLVIASRTYAAAARLATAYHGHAADLEHLPSLLANADLVITAARTSAPLIEPSAIPHRAPGQPLLLVDIAVPRNVDPAVAQVAGVELIDLDRLHAAMPRGAGDLSGFEAAWTIVDTFVAQHATEARMRRAVPVIAALRAHVDSQKDAELGHTLARLAHLAPADRDAVAQLAHRLVNRMFHHLATRLKLATTLPDGDAYLAALAFLFDEAGTEYKTVTAPVLVGAQPPAPHATYADAIVMEGRSCP